MAIPFTVTSRGAFQTALRTRATLWSSTRPGARLTVPPELAWWYYQEFGTVGPYVIEPNEATHLVFEQGGTLRFEKRVLHPGVKPKRMVTKVLPEIHQFAIQKTHEAFQKGALDNPSILSEAILQAMNEAKSLIVKSIAENLPGTRPINTEFPKQSGKLEGRTAASVFEEQSVVTPTE